MAYFANIESAVVASTLEFVSVTANTMQQFTCKNGEIAGWKIVKLPVLGGFFNVSQVYDCSTGVPALKGTVAVVPGIDLTGGYFSSGCFPTGDPLVDGTKYYKVNYV